MALHLWKRNRKFWVRGTFQGKPFEPRPLDVTNRTIAEQMRQALELELHDAKAKGGAAERLSWREFSRRFMAFCGDTVKPGTYKKYDFVIGRFGLFLELSGALWLEDITGETIQRYLDQRRLDTHPTRRQHVSTEGLKSDQRILRRAFSFAIERGHLTRSPLKGKNLNAKSANTQPFEEADIEAMLSTAQAEAQAGPRQGTQARRDLPVILLTFLSTGLRIGDVMHLQKTAIDLAAERMVVHTRKRGRTVSLPIPPELLEALTAHLATLDPANPLVFPTEEGKVTRHLDRLLRNLWDRCGVKGGHAHRFRDTYAVELLKRGASLYDVSKLLGITQKVAEQHYAPYCSELQERANRLANQLRFRPGPRLVVKKKK